LDAISGALHPRRRDTRFIHSLCAFYAKAYAYRKRRIETAQKVAELTVSTADNDSGSDTAAEQASISSDSSVEDRDEQF
jgi:hypothetical protein